MARRRWTEALHETLASWGLQGIRAPKTHQARSIRVFGPSLAGGRVFVGELSHERDEWVFRYSDAYRDSGNPPIAAFPDLRVDDYRSTRLFPFFEVRLPPVDRDDVQQFLESKKIDKTDVLALLGVLGGTIATSPYQLELVDEAPRRRLTPATT